MGKGSIVRNSNGRENLKKGKSEDMGAFQFNIQNPKNITHGVVHDILSQDLKESEKSAAKEGKKG